MLALALTLFALTKPATVKGTFIVDGVKADLKYARAVRTVLDDKGKKGYIVLLSQRAATDDLAKWKTGDPKERGNFIHIMFEQNGAVWVAEIGHEAAKTGRFGVVAELQTVSFKVDGDRITAHVQTQGEVVFTEDHYTIDLTFDVPIESK